MTSRLDLEGWFPSSGFHVFFRALDVYSSILLKDIELVEVVGSWSILNVAGLHIEAGFRSLAEAGG